MQTIKHAGWMFICGMVLVGATAGQVSSAANQDHQSLLDIIAAIERGWEAGDGAPFREHFLDFEGARYIESGGQNKGLNDLVEHHVEPEKDALSGLDLRFTNVETHFEGDFAWAIADVEVIATVVRTGRHIHNRGHQTFLFRRVGQDWKVVHTHSSSRPVKKED